MHNFLTVAAADCDDVLVVKPQKVMSSPGRKNQIAHTFEDGTIQVREVTRILEDGVIISSKNTNRRIIEPDVDVVNEDKTLQDIAKIVRTPEKVAAYSAKKAALAEIEGGK